MLKNDIKDKLVGQRRKKMIKTMCDICGKEIPPIKFLKSDDHKKFNISTCGRRWDLCDECQTDLNIWLTNICLTRGEWGCKATDRK